VIDLLPLIAFGLIAVMITIMIYNWRALSDAVGFGLAKKRRAKTKRSRTVQLIVWMAAWAIAIVVLIDKCGGVLSCKTPDQTANLSTPVRVIVNGSGPLPSLPLLDTAVQLGSLIQTNWLYAIFLGFLIVSSVIVGRGVLVSLKEIKNETINEMPVPSEAIVAVEDAVRILRSQPQTDPRTRIINCYERMIAAAQGLGATVTSDQTARELETSIRKMLLVKGSEIRDLTDLFEEARYSLHPITEEDAAKAQDCLLGIADEMNIILSV